MDRESLKEMNVTLIATHYTRAELDAALECYRQALILEPNNAVHHSSLIYAMLFHPNCDPRTIAKECARWTQQHGRPLKAPTGIPKNDRKPDRRLRVGYVSPDFRDHVVGRNVLPLFEKHDREKFEIFGYSDVVRPDSVTNRFRALASVWQDTASLPEARLAEMICDDEVDIPVDLTQHLAGNRLPMFAHRPAPVQVSFAGYPGSAGLKEIGYHLSDPFLELPEMARYRGFSEAVYLESFFGVILPSIASWPWGFFRFWKRVILPSVV